MKKFLFTLFVLPTIATAQPEEPGEQFAGWRSETLQRNGRNLPCIIYYPALSEGSLAPVNNNDGPYPIIAFGHGFFMQTSYYISLFKHLATHGYIVIAPQFPDTQHGQLALDLIFCINFIKDSDSNPLSVFYGLVNKEKTGISGHSMGGGASLLAASIDSTILVVAPLAAAETSPSAIAVMSLIKAVVYLISAQNDGITPPSSNQMPMYNSANAIKGLPIIKGGNHTRFMDFTAWDWTDPRGYRTREEQLKLTRRYLTAVYNLFLHEDRTMWNYAFGNEVESDTMMIFSKELKPLAPSVFNLLSPENGITINLPDEFVWQNSYSLNGEDEVKHTLELSDDSLFSSISFNSGELNDTLFSLNELSSGDYFWRVKSKTSDSTFRYSEQVFSFTISPSTFVENNYNPSDFILMNNYPNPFNPSTKISFSIPYKATVKLAVYNILGMEVAVIIDEQMSSGMYSLDFNADALPSGMYIYKLSAESVGGAGNFIQTKKMMLVK